MCLCATIKMIISAITRGNGFILSNTSQRTDLAMYRYNRLYSYGFKKQIKGGNMNVLVYCFIILWTGLFLTVFFSARLQRVSPRLEFAQTYVCLKKGNYRYLNSQVLNSPPNNEGELGENKTRTTFFLAFCISLFKLLLIKLFWSKK